MSSSSHPNKRLLSVLSHGISELGEGERLSFIDINKILFYLERRLNEDNELREHLTPYWYQDGPMVTTVQSVVNWGQSVGALEKADGWFHASHPTTELPEDDDVREAKRAIEAVLDEDYPIAGSLDEKIEQVYEDAPFEFQRRFKRRVLPMIEDLDSFPPASPDEVYRAVNSAEAYLPLEEAFAEVNACYAEYLDVSQAFLAPKESLSGDEIEAYTELSESYWVLFCKKLRLETVGPDIEEDRLAYWEETYRDGLEEFRIGLAEFEEAFVEASANTQPPSRVSEDSSWGRVANELLNNSD